MIFKYFWRRENFGLSLSFAEHFFLEAPADAALPTDALFSLIYDTAFEGETTRLFLWFPFFSKNVTLLRSAKAPFQICVMRFSQRILRLPLSSPLAYSVTTDQKCQPLIGACWFDHFGRGVRLSGRTRPKHCFI
jgi:hypothetical protein